MSSIVVTVAPGEPLAARVDGQWIELRPKERVVAAALAMYHPNAITLSQLIGLVWPESAPATAQQSIHNHLARLRTAAPGLVDSHVAGYVFGDGVSIEVDASAIPGDAIDTDFLIEFADIPEVRRARTEFIRRHVTIRRPDPTDTLRNGPDPGVIEHLEDAVRFAPGDERTWWLLAIAATRTTGIASGVGVIDRARLALGDAGLGLGRRLLDLEGMLRDGVDDIHVLLRDPYGSRSDGIDPLDDAISRRLEAVRQVWTEHEQFLICVRGPDNALRRAVLARIIDDARASGFSTAFARHLHGDIGPPTLRMAHRGARPVVMVADGFEQHHDPPKLAERVSERLPSPPTGWVIAQPADASNEAGLHVAGLDADTPLLIVETPTPLEVAVDGDLRSPIERAPASTRHLLRLLAAIGEPIKPEYLATVEPSTIAAALDAARAGFARVDAATQTIDLASNGVAAVALEELDGAGRRALAIDLLSLELPGLDAARRCELRSRWSIEAYGAQDERTIAQTIEAADAYSLRGQYDVAASICQRTLDPIVTEHGRSAAWCQLAIHAGRAMLAGGDPNGDELLADVVAAASELDDEAVVAYATHEWCRLGTAGGAGSADDVRLQLTSDLLTHLSNPADRALVGAANAMVLSLAGEPTMLRERFLAAFDDATVSTDRTALAEVLPMAYMSLPLHSDVDARLGHAATLEQLADELDRPDARWEALQLRYSCEVMVGDPTFRSTLAELSDVASHLHEHSREWEMHFIRSNAALIDGDLERARREVDRSLEFAGQVSEERVLAVFGAHHLVASMVERSAGELLDTLRTLCADQPGIGAWHAARAVAAASAGEHDEAVTSLHNMTDGDELRLVHDPVYSAGLIAFGEAAAATGDRESLARADLALEPLAGTWSWCGSCTFGPIDLTRARVAAALGDRKRAEKIAADAVVTCAEMRAPVFAQHATDLLLEIAAT